jgi:hypothetical protein
MAKPERRDPAKEQRWRRLLERWRRSGRTGRDFCAEHGLSEPSFYAWRREIARRDQEAVPRSRAKRPLVRAAAGGRKPAFVQMTIAAGAPAETALEVVAGNSRVVRVRSGFDPEAFRQLLRLLEEPAC